MTNVGNQWVLSLEKVIRLLPKLKRAGAGISSRDIVKRREERATSYERQ